MTQAPTHGPLSGDDVKLIVKGDLLLHPQEGVVTFSCFGDDGALICSVDAHTSWTDEAQTFAFIGRPDADGWMPWSGGENPVPGQRVELRLKSGITSGVYASEEIDWSCPCCFRLAPTAPVEASGSERDYTDAEILRDTVPADLRDGEIVAFGLRMEGAAGLYPSIRNTEEGASKLAARLAEESPENPPYVPVALSLRPQPSGETRDKLRDHFEAMQKMATAYLVPEDYRDREGRVVFQGTEHNSPAWKYEQAGERAKAFANDMIYMLDGPEEREALLSARPLALGGQQGEGSHPCYDEHQPGCDCVIAEQTASPIPSYLERLSTTPARAEAQDEGAAK